MKKVVSGAAEAVEQVKDGSTILLGGFGLCGIPENLIAALKEKGAKDLTLVSNNAGTDDFGIGLLIRNGQVKKMIMSYGGECKAFEEGVLAGKLQVEWNPQGTLAERLRAGGAGIAGFYTPTGVGTPVAEGKESREFDGRTYLFERGLKADFAFVKAWKGDPLGNLVFRKTARNFNAVMATAATTTIAEVEQLVETGALAPDSIHTPGIFVKKIFKGASYMKPIEKRTVRPRAAVALILLAVLLAAPLRAEKNEAAKAGSVVNPQGYTAGEDTSKTPDVTPLPIGELGQPASNAGIHEGKPDTPAPAAKSKGGTWGKAGSAAQDAGSTQSAAPAAAKSDRGKKSGGQGKGGGQAHADRPAKDAKAAAGKAADKPAAAPAAKPAAKPAEKPAAASKTSQTHGAKKDSAAKKAVLPAKAKD